MRINQKMIALLILAPLAQQLAAQVKPAAANAVTTGLAVRAIAVSAPADSLRDPLSVAWQPIAAQRIGLNRTPPVYDTDPPAELEIPMVEVQLARAGGKLFVHLAWKDATENTAALAAMPSTPPESRNYKEHTQSTERFFDAAAVMFPATASSSGISPSLQMGSPDDPVAIYYWNAARGAMLMQAHGRGTTQRTGQTFPARAAYRSASWQVVLELPELPAGQPLAFAVWNGSQSDRDGRKYFSVWHILE